MRRHGQDNKQATKLTACLLGVTPTSKAKVMPTVLYSYDSRYSHDARAGESGGPTTLILTDNFNFWLQESFVSLQFLHSRSWEIDIMDYTLFALGTLIVVINNSKLYEDTGYYVI
jgi:hypothetical protein